MQYLVPFLVLQSSRRRRELFASINLCTYCHVAVSALCLFLAVPHTSLYWVTEAFPGHTHCFTYGQLLRLKIECKPEIHKYFRAGQ